MVEFSFDAEKVDPWNGTANIKKRFKIPYDYAMHLIEEYRNIELRDMTLLLNWAKVDSEAFDHLLVWAKHWEADLTDEHKLKVYAVLVNGKPEYDRKLRTKYRNSVVGWVAYHIMLHFELSQEDTADVINTCAVKGFPKVGRLRNIIIEQQQGLARNWWQKKKKK